MPQEQDQNSITWPTNIQDDPMVANIGDDDFSKFLDLDTDFQFDGLDHGYSGLDTPMGRLGFGQSHLQGSEEMEYQDEQTMSVILSGGNLSDAQRSAMTHPPQFHAYQHYHQMPIGHNYNVPPTPVSADMQAKYGHRLDNNGNMVFDGLQVSFTPLVSPAQTPLSGGFVMPEYGMNDEFFSPLTSPALEGQAAFSLTGPTASPVDGSADTGSSKFSGPVTRRRGRRGSFSGRTPARSVKQSPAMKPQTRRRQPSIGTLPLDKIEAMLSQPTLDQKQLLQSKLSSNNSVRASDDSVSPEPLSEALMRPPPIPLSNERSPRILLPSQGSAGTNPVTPTTLMKMPSNPEIAAKAARQAQKVKLVGDSMEDIMLPDAATPSFLRPPLTHLDTSTSVDSDQSTPTMSAKSAKVSASSTPRGLLVREASLESFNKAIKTDGKGARGKQKRPITTTATVSPAIRPRISPSISPLVPGHNSGMSRVSAETSALYLASKSNYQNILDGTHLPGVSYPEALAENLSSKRTSHKIAEQGRRNRINIALKEIEGLLPASITAASGKRERRSSAENEDAEKASSSNQGASKASTVEMAITYIKALQMELNETREKLDSAEKKLAEGRSSSGSQASPE